DLGPRVLFCRLCALLRRHRTLFGFVEARAQRFQLRLGSIGPLPDLPGFRFGAVPGLLDRAPGALPGFLLDALDRFHGPLASPGALLLRLGASGLPSASAIPR